MAGITELRQVRHGPAALQALEKKLGRPLTEMEAHIAMLEGYSPTTYKDHKGNKTTGVGATGEWANVPFDKVVQGFEDKTRQMVAGYDQFPDYLQKELVQAAYRGDLGQSKKAVEKLNAGQYDAAAQEFLRNEEYRDKQTPMSIKKRMEAVADAMRNYGQLQGGVTDLLGPIRNKVDQRRMAEEMGDMEFEMDVAPYSNYTGDIDASKARYHGWEGPGRLDVGGFRIPPDVTDEELENERPSYRFRDPNGKVQQMKLERDTVNAINDEATPITWGHEFTHLNSPGLSEGPVRLVMAGRVQTEPEWRESVRIYADWENRRRDVPLTYEEAERELLDELEYSSKSSYGYLRGAYEDELEAGATLPEERQGWFSDDLSDYADMREENTYWRKRQRQLEEQDDAPTSIADGYEPVSDQAGVTVMPENFRRGGRVKLI